jgi:predicted permease
MLGRRDSGIRQLQANGAKYVGVVDAVSSDYFSTLGVKPLIGRAIDASDIDLKRGSNPVAVLSYRCWKDHYAGRGDVLGQMFTLDGIPLTIIGVTGESFTGMSVEGTMEATVPLGLADGFHTPLLATEPLLFVRGRLKPGITSQQAQAQLQTVWSAIRKEQPPDVNGPASLPDKVEVTRASTGDSFLRERLAGPLFFLLSLAAVLLLVACANLANLQLTMSLKRRQNLSIRMALGASRAKILQLFLMESSLLAAAGCACAIVFALVSTRLIFNMVWAGYFPNLALKPVEIGFDTRTVLFALGLTCAAALLMTTGPAVLLSRKQLLAAGLMHGSRMTGSQAGRAARFFLGLQVALSVALLAAAIAFVSNLIAIRTADRGYAQNGVLIANLFPTERGDIPGRTEYYRELASKVARLPGVRAVSFSNFGPISGYEPTAKVTRSSSSSTPVSVAKEIVGPAFFTVLRMHLLRGRDFDWHDDDLSRPVAIVSEELARRLFPAGDAVGNTIEIRSGNSGKALGIVGTVSNASLWQTQHRDPMAIYLPLMQYPGYDSVHMDVGFAGNDSTDVAKQLLAAVSSMGRHVVLRAQTLKERLDGLLTTERVLALLGLFLGASALLLTSIGVYGAISFIVTQTTREIGIRLALGAQRSQVLAHVLSYALVVIVGGVATGSTGAFLAFRLTASVSNLTLSYVTWIIPASALLLGCVALMAAWIPAQRAAGIDPIEAIRTEYIKQYPRISI